MAIFLIESYLCGQIETYQQQRVKEAEAVGEKYDELQQALQYVKDCKAKSHAKVMELKKKALLKYHEDKLLKTKAYENAITEELFELKKALEKKKNANYKQYVHV